MPAMPSTSPKPAATTALAVTITQRAGCAMTALARVPCWTSEVNISVPTMEASMVVSQVEKMNVWLIVNGSWVSGSVLTNVARIHDSRTPMTTVPARMAGVERSERSLIHSLRMAAGHGGEVVARRCGWCRVRSGGAW